MICKEKYHIDNINFTDNGEGQIVLLVNGQFVTIKNRGPIIMDLERYFRVINLEFPNQGDSPIDNSFNHLLKYANFVKHFLKELEIDPQEIIVHGHSFGANLIRAMVLEQNIQFKAAIVSGITPPSLINYFTILQESSLGILHAANIKEFGKSLAIKILSPQFINETPEIVQQISELFHALYNDKIEALISLIEAPYHYFKKADINILNRPFGIPVHIIGGANDVMIPQECVKEYANRIHADSIHILKGGHFLLLENPLEYSKILNELIEQYQ